MAVQIKHYNITTTPGLFSSSFNLNYSKLNSKRNFDFLNRPVLGRRAYICWVGLNKRNVFRSVLSWNSCWL